MKLYILKEDINSYIKAGTVFVKDVKGIYTDGDYYVPEEKDIRSKKYAVHYDIVENNPHLFEEYSCH